MHWLRPAISVRKEVEKHTSSNPVSKKLPELAPELVQVQEAMLAQVLLPEQEQMPVPKPALGAVARTSSFNPRSGNLRRSIEEEDIRAEVGRNSTNPMVPRQIPARFGRNHGGGNLIPSLIPAMARGGERRRGGLERGAGTWVGAVGLWRSPATTPAGMGAAGVEWGVFLGSGGRLLRILLRDQVYSSDS
jgi:hypothetical protein